MKTAVLCAICALCTAVLCAAEEIEWAWDAVEGAAGYRWQIDSEDEGGWTYEDADTTSLTLEGAESGRIYTLYVQSTLDGTAWSPSETLPGGKARAEFGDIEWRWESDAFALEYRWQLDSEERDSWTYERTNGAERTMTYRLTDADMSMPHTLYVQRRYSGSYWTPSAAGVYPGGSLPEGETTAVVGIAFDSTPDALEWRWEPEAWAARYRVQLDSRKDDGWIVLDEGEAVFRLEDTDLTRRHRLYIEREDSEGIWSPYTESVWTGKANADNYWIEDAKTAVVDVDLEQVTTALKWTWEADGAARYRWQIDSQDEGGWTEVRSQGEGEILSALIEDADVNSPHTFYIQRLYHGTVWSKTLAEAAYGGYPADVARAEDGGATAVIPVEFEETPVDLEWRWTIEPWIPYYRYQVDAEVPDGWIVVDVETDGVMSYRIRDTDLTVPHTLYVQKMYEEGVWSRSATGEWGGDPESPESVIEENHTAVVTVNFPDAVEDLEWRWVSQAGITQYRYQLDGRDADGWTYSDAAPAGDMMSFRLEHINPYRTYTLYVESTADGSNWLSADGTVWRARLGEEEPEEPAPAAAPVMLVQGAEPSADVAGGQDESKYSLGLSFTYGTQIGRSGVESESYLQEAEQFADKLPYKHNFNIDVQFGWRFSEHLRLAASAGVGRTIFMVEVNNAVQNRWVDIIPVTAGVELVSPRVGQFSFFAGAYGGAFWRFARMTQGSEIKMGPILRVKAGVDFKITERVTLTLGAAVTWTMERVRAQSAGVNGQQYTGWNCQIFGEPVSAGLKFTF